MTSAMTRPVNSSSITFTLSHSVRCIKKNKIQSTISSNSFSLSFTAQTMLPYMLCLNEIHYREQICLRLSLAEVMSLNPHYKIKSIILLVFTIAANNRIGLSCLLNVLQSELLQPGAMSCYSMDSYLSPFLGFRDYFVQV